MTLTTGTSKIGIVILQSSQLLNCNCQTGSGQSFENIIKICSLLE
jgi:hypothetical protein